MPNFNQLAVCPYYERESELSVTCEGVCHGMYFAVKFDETGDKKEWFARYCANFGYEECPCARMIGTVKYGGSYGCQLGSKI